MDIELIIAKELNCRKGQVEAAVRLIDEGSTAVSERSVPAEVTKTYYDLRGRRLKAPKGLCIEKSSDGTSRKLYADY